MMLFLDVGYTKDRNVPTPFPPLATYNLGKPGVPPVRASHKSQRGLNGPGAHWVDAQDPYCIQHPAYVRENALGWNRAQA
jgi:hypothetical protein